MRAKYGKYHVELRDELPDSFSQYLLANVERFYRGEFVSMPAGPEAVPLSHAAFQEREFDRLAAAVRGALDMEAIYRMMED